MNYNEHINRVADYQRKIGINTIILLLGTVGVYCLKEWNTLYFGYIIFLLPFYLFLLWWGYRPIRLAKQTQNLNNFEDKQLEKTAHTAKWFWFMLIMMEITLLLGWIA